MCVYYIIHYTYTNDDYIRFYTTTNAIIFYLFDYFIHVCVYSHYQYFLVIILRNRNNIILISKRKFIYVYQYVILFNIILLYSTQHVIESHASRIVLSVFYIRTYDIHNVIVIILNTVKLFTLYTCI